MEHQTLMVHRRYERVTVLKRDTVEGDCCICLFFSLFRREVYLVLHAFNLGLECKSLGMIIFCVQPFLVNRDIEVLVSLCEFTFS